MKLNKGWFNLKRRAYSISQSLIPLCILIIVMYLIITKCITYAQEQTFITQLRTAYRYLTRAYITTENEYGTPDFWNLNNKNNSTPGRQMILALSHGMPDVKICETRQNCPYISYTSLDAKKPLTIGDNIFANNYTKALLGKNMIIYATTQSPKCNLNFGTSDLLKKVCGQIIVDVNGINKPNVFGKDTFIFYLTQYGIVPAGLKEDTKNSFQNECNPNNSHGYGCTGWVLLNLNMEYLHNDKLNWN